MLGSRHPEPAQAQAAAQQLAATPDEPCANFAKTFADCMSDSNGELEACRYYFDKLQVRAPCVTHGSALSASTLNARRCEVLQRSHACWVC